LSFTTEFQTPTNAVLHVQGYMEFALGSDTIKLLVLADALCVRPAAAASNPKARRCDSVNQETREADHARAPHQYLPMSTYRSERLVVNGEYDGSTLDYLIVKTVVTAPQMTDEVMILVPSSNDFFWTGDGEPSIRQSRAEQTRLSASTNPLTANQQAARTQAYEVAAGSVENTLTGQHRIARHFMAAGSMARPKPNQRRPRPLHNCHRQIGHLGRVRPTYRYVWPSPGSGALRPGHRHVHGSDLRACRRPGRHLTIRQRTMALECQRHHDTALTVVTRSFLAVLRRTLHLPDYKLSATRPADE
jgi:hypothetical protein